MSLLKKESLVLIGMRGVGKTTLGRVAAEFLELGFVDIDELIEDRMKRSCADIIHQDGWAEFRRIEAQVLGFALEVYMWDTVISCGGGIVETKDSRATLKAFHGPVVHIVKCLQDINIVLGLVNEDKKITHEVENVCSSAETSARPAFSESIEVVLKRRQPWFQECSTHCFEVRDGDTDWEGISYAFQDFVRGIYFPIHKSIWEEGSWIRQLRFEDKEVSSEEFTKYDAILLTNLSPSFRLADAYCTPPMPLILDCKSEKDLVVTAIRYGMPFLRVNDCSTALFALEMCRQRWKHNTKIIFELNAAVMDENDFNENGILKDLMKCKENMDDLLYVTVEYPNRKFVDCLRNIFEDNVSHIGVVADGAKANMEQIRELLPLGPLVFQKNDHEIAFPKRGLVTTSHYYLFGHPIALSPSPAMHNTAFSLLGLKSVYRLCDTLSPRKIKCVLRNHRFMGASVTVPHKETILGFLDQLSVSARKIGAVNTIIKDQQTGELIGDNTDWWGIYSLVREPLRKRTTGKQKKGVALIIGAGGTAKAACYCASQLGLELLVYNRTIEKAQRLACTFGGRAIVKLDDIDSVDLIVGTIPAASGFQLPVDSILRICKPIVVDAAYRPRRTALLNQAQSCGCENFEGIDMLIEQGKKQLELWTGIKCLPAVDIAKAAREFYDLTCA